MKNCILNGYEVDGSAVAHIEPGETAVIIDHPDSVFTVETLSLSQAAECCGVTEQALATALPMFRHVKIEGGPTLIDREALVDTVADFCTRELAADVLGVTVGRVSQMCKDGRLACYRFSHYRTMVSRKGLENKLIAALDRARRLTARVKKRIDGRLDPLPRHEHEFVRDEVAAELLGTTPKEVTKGLVGLDAREYKGVRLGVDRDQLRSMVVGSVRPPEAAEMLRASVSSVRALGLPTLHLSKRHVRISCEGLRAYVELAELDAAEALSRGRRLITKRN